MRPRRSLLGAAFGFVTCVVTPIVAAASCGGDGFVVPQSDMTDDLVAQSDMQNLREAWDASTPRDRVGLVGPLRDHVRRHPEDPTSRAASSMLALVLLEQGQLDDANRIAAPLVEGPAGMTHDRAKVVVGASLRQRGQSKQALAELGPLENQVIDPPARSILNSELLLAAVDAKRFDLGARYLKTFIAQADPRERKARREEVARLVGLFPAPLSWICSSANRKA